MNELPDNPQPEVTIRTISTWVPPYLTAWLHSLKWDEDQPVTFRLEQEVLPDGHEVGSDGQKWRRWKPGNHRTATIIRERDGQIWSQRFVQIADAWMIDHGDPMLSELVHYIQEQDASLSVKILPPTIREDLKVVTMRKMHKGKEFGVDWALTQVDLQQIAAKEALFQVADGYIEQIQEATRDL